MINKHILAISGGYLSGNVQPLALIRAPYLFFTFITRMMPLITGMFTTTTWRKSA